MTQKSRLLEHLKVRPINRLEGWDTLGILELPARICELKADGHRINTRLKRVLNRYGDMVQIAEWSMEEPF
jgi:hypothetical protein